MSKVSHYKREFNIAERAIASGVKIRVYARVVYYAFSNEIEKLENNKMHIIYENRK